MKPKKTTNRFSIIIITLNSCWSSLFSLQVSLITLVFPSTLASHCFDSASNFIIIIIIYSFRVFHISVSWWSFTGVWVTASLLKSPGLAVLNNTVVWMVSTRPPTFKSSSPSNSPLVTVPNAPITIGITVTFMFHSFFNSQARSKY